MKKLLINLSVTLLILFSFSVVMADGGGPSFTSFRAKVSNINGAPYYSEIYGDGELIPDGTLEYNTRIEVLDTAWHYGDGGAETKFFAFLISSEKTDKDWYSQIKYILPSDVYYDQDLTSMDDYVISKESIGLFSFTKGGLEVHEWPIDDSRVVARIPFGTEFVGSTLEEVKNIASYGGDYTYWYYISYNNVKGFISTYDGNLLGYKTENNEAYAYKTQPLFEEPYSDEAKELGMVPKGTVLNVIANTGRWGYGNPYVEYNGKKGFLRDVAQRRYSNYLVVWHDGAKLYSEPNTSSTVLNTIPLDTILKGSWDYGETDYGEAFALVDYKGTQGWIKYTDKYNVDLYKAEREYSDWVIRDELFVYAVRPSNSDFTNVEQLYIEQLKNAGKTEEEITEIVFSGDRSGEVKSGDISVVVEPNNPEEDLPGVVEVEPQTVGSTQAPKNELMEVIIIGISSALILFLTSIVLLLLLNKKKKD